MNNYQYEWNLFLLLIRGLIHMQKSFWLVYQFDQFQYGEQLEKLEFVH